MLLLALKSLFFVAAIFAYSTGVWRLINDYFRQEFRTFLYDEVKKNKYLMVDPDRSNSESTPPPVEIISESEVRKAHGSVTANRLLDELIVGFGRLFTSGKRPEPAGDRTTGQRMANEIITSTAKDAPLATGSAVLVDGDGSGTGRTRDGADPGDPGGGAVIESDKFPRSSPSEQEDNKSDRSDGHDDANTGDDDEEKWIKYWKNRERGQSLTSGGGTDGSYCDAAAAAVVVDACGP